MAWWLPPVIWQNEEALWQRLIAEAYRNGARHFVAGAPWQGWAGLPDATKAILAGAMVVGRLETLVILALLSPEYWRR